MLDNPIICPICDSPYGYEDRGSFHCPECAHEWHTDPSSSPSETGDDLAVSDAYGSPLKDGDSITVIKDLKVKGSSSVVKVGTKVRNIQIVDGDHNIYCKIPGIGQMGLKSEFVKKIQD